MRGKCIGVLILVNLLFVAAAAGAESGTLRGFVLDLGTGATVHDVVVEIEPGGVVVRSDIDGMFSVDLPAGEYRLRARKPGYLDKIVEGVKVGAGREIWQDVPIVPEAGVLQETVEVVASSEKATVEALLVERKSLAVLTDGIGRQEMSLLPGGDGADVMARVTGVSVVDDRYVYVRGLGERYSSTQLNGAEIPSTQPDKKVVAMDLFPSGLLENVETVKSFTPDLSGEFAGGLVRVNALDFPRRATLKVSYGTSFNTLTTFKPFLDYAGGKFDFWGYDDGSRALPAGIPATKIVRGTFFSPGLTPEKLQELGRLFPNQWSPSAASDARPGQKFSIVGGNTWGPLGFVVAATHNTTYATREERRTYYAMDQGVLNPFSDYDFDISSTTARTGLLANLAYRVGNDHKITFKNFYTHEGRDESRIFEGFNRDINTHIRDLRLRFTEEAIYSGQVAGEHYLPLFGNSLLEWKVTRSRSDMDEPDLREVMYEFSSAEGRYVLADESQSGFREFINLNEVVWDPELSWTTFFHGGAFIGSIKAGFAYRQRDRDFWARRFRFVPRSFKGIDKGAPPEVLFAPENIRPDGFELREETRNTDTYHAQEWNRAAFLMADVSTGRWRFVGGVRRENHLQRVVTFDLFNPDLVTVATELRNQDWLPALNVLYQLSGTMNLRFSASETLNRPEFRELAPFDFTDVVGGRTVQGFPELQQATIQNYDVRWEWFPGARELISASFFYKRFDKPIERVVEATAQLRTSFRNAERARNFGFELDFRKNLGFLWSGLSNFEGIVNYTFVDSDVTIPKTGIVVLTTLKRPLEGQSRHVFNGVLEYSHPRVGSTLRALVNFQGARISDVGALGLPDILEDGRTRLDAVFLQPLGAARRWTLRFAAENLLDEPIRFTQGGLPQREYRVGRTFSFSISHEFLGER
ncbi:MAG: TonB-dependent receptor [Acidobacteriota bacterium]